jgi:anaerobic selenocysteine-containing dehydrogenase
VNETTRHANVILPPEAVLARPHFDLAFANLAIRNVANWSPALVELEPHEMPEWQILLRLAAIAGGAPPTDDTVAALDDLVVADGLQRAVAQPGSPLNGRDPQELMAQLDCRRGPERVVDVMLRTGPYGDFFGEVPDGLTLARLEESPHGIDLGPLEPRLPDVLRTPSGNIELAPESLVADVERIHESLDAPANGDGLLLVGRRDLRSNNSWMHNVEVLVKGKERCTLHVHPDDAERHGLVDGGRAKVASVSGSVEAPVEVTDAVMVGVVSLPHGWGHDVDGVRLSVAAGRPGVNSNVLAGTNAYDPLSGNAILNGIPVTVAPA